MMLRARRNRIVKWENGNIHMIECERWRAVLFKTNFKSHSEATEGNDLKIVNDILYEMVKAAETSD